MTQDELATEIKRSSGQTLKVSSNQISRWERGIQLPATKVLPALAAALGLDPRDLALLVVDASLEETQAARRDRDVLMERLERFADKYEELGHTYAANHGLLSQLVAHSETILKRLAALETRLAPPAGEDPPPGRTPRRRP